VAYWAKHVDEHFIYRLVDYIILKLCKDDRRWVEELYGPIELKNFEC
jgi:hypothetical protein